MLQVSGAETSKMFLFFKYCFIRRKWTVFKIAMIISFGILCLLLYSHSKSGSTRKLILQSVNISTVELVLNNQVCDENITIKLLILITSYIGNISLRNKIREEYPVTLLNSLGIQRLFLLGKPNPAHPINYTSILHENSKYHDIILGNFQEHYHNLTYKHLLGLNWVLTSCSHAQFILKQDDDIWIDLHSLVNDSESEFQQLFETLRTSFTIFGNVLQRNKVIRDLNSKWYVPEEEFQNVIYPDFVSGWAYLTTTKVIKLLIDASYRVPFFWIDDTYITGILRTKITSKTIRLIKGNKYFALHSDYTECCKNIIKKRLNSSHFYSCPFLFGPTVDQPTVYLLNNHSEQCSHHQKNCIRPNLTTTELLLTCPIAQAPNPKLSVPNRHGKPVEIKPLNLVRSRDT